MANTITSPNMSLPIPVVGVDPGPDFATNINSSLTLIDRHDHSAGSGVQITPAGLNINAPVSMGGNFLINAAGMTFSPQSVTPANSTIYENGVDLYYVDGAGNNVRLTSGGAVNATSSGISSGNASASFSGGVLVVDSNNTNNTPGNVQCASILLGNNLPGSNFVTLSPINSLGAGYALTLPAIPAQTNVMTLNTSGGMSSVTFDAVGQTMTSVGADAIGSSMSSTGANAVAASRTRSTGSTVGIGGVAQSTSGSGSFSTNSGTATAVTNLTCTITTSGRPVYAMLVPDNSVSSSAQCGIGITSGGIGYVSIYRASTVLVGTGSLNSPSQTMTTPPGGIAMVDFPAAGTYLYSVKAYSSNVSYFVDVFNCKLVVYEL